MARPGVSIVIPTRDRPDLLALTLRSVLGQRDADIEVIVVDDGDGPETAAVVHRIEDARIRLVRTSALRGECAARNSGMEAAAREWVAFCDDDDLWAPDKLWRQLSAAHEHNAQWVYAGEVTVNADLRVLSGAAPLAPHEVMRDLPRYNCVPAGASNVMVHAAALQRAGAFDPGLRTSGDWDMWLRLARAAGTPACVPRPLVALRMHAQMVSRRAASILSDIELIAARYGTPVDRARHRRWLAWMALEDGRRWTAVRHYANAMSQGDWRSIGRAMVALVDPGVTTRRKPQPADPWVTEAQEWLNTLRASVGVRTS